MRPEDVKDSDTFFKKGKRQLRHAEIGDTFVLEHVDGTPYRTRLMGYAKNVWGEVAVLYMYSKLGSSLSPDAGGTRLEHLMLPPLCVSTALWRRGYARFEARVPLTPRERLAVHCFTHRWTTDAEPYVPISFVDELERPIECFRPYGISMFFLELGVMAEILVRHTGSFYTPSYFHPDSLASTTRAANGEIITLESMAAELASPYPTEWPVD